MPLYNHTHASHEDMKVKDCPDKPDAKDVICLVLDCKWIGHVEDPANPWGTFVWHLRLQRETWANTVLNRE